MEYYEAAADKQAITDTLRKCDSLIVLSQSWKEYFASIGMDTTKIHVLNNIVSPPKLLPEKHIYVDWCVLMVVSYVVAIGYHWVVKRIKW